MTRPFNNPECCFLCRRRADGMGVGTPKKQGWLCKECGIPLAKAAYHMTDKAFDVFEQRAIEKAGEKGGAYLDELNKTDLAALTPTEYRLFINTVIREFGDAIRQEVEGGKPPF
jgi:ribosomal protein L37AE/L43A